MVKRHFQILKLIAAGGRFLEAVPSGSLIPFFKKLD